MAGNNVPGMEQSPQFSQNVPGVQFPFRQEFGREGAGIQHLGEGIETLARTGGEIYDEVQRQHDISTSSKNYVEASVAHNQQLQNMKLTSPDGFVRDPQTNEVVQNSDGSQRTIAQEYWDWADQDFQARQQNMSPRAAAMFRQQMLPHIGENTKYLQNEGLRLQTEYSNQAVKESMGTLARDNDRQPWSDEKPYYQEQRPDGTINLRGNTDKINEQLRTISLWTARQGPADGKPGNLAPADVLKASSDRLSAHADNWARSAVTDILENDTPRDHKNRVSTTAVQQVLNLRDVIEGADPQSKDAMAKGLPTVSSSLTSDQRDKWRAQLNSMLDGAKKIDKSDYELQLQQMKDATKSGHYPSFDALVRSPEFAYLAHAAEPLGMTPEQQMKDMSEIFGNAARTAGHTGVSDLASDSTKRAQIAENIKSFSTGFPQYAGMLGVKFTGAMATGIIGEAGKSAESQLEEESKQYKEDPAKFAAGLASGPQDPQRLKYRSSTMKAVEDKLYADPSIFAPMKALPNGQPVIQGAIKEMKRIGSMGFGAGFEPTFLSKEAYQSWATKIEKSGNPEQIEQMFQQLNKTAGGDSGTVLDQLVKVGKLDPRYQIAQNLPTPQARIAAYSDIMSKGAAIEAYEKSDDGEKAGVVWNKAQKANEDQIDFANRLYGADSPEASKAVKMLNQTWASAYAAAMGVKGTSQSEATRAANERVSAQIPPVSHVGDTHNFLGFSFGTSGPQSKVQFSRPDLSDDQKQTIAKNLNQAQKEEALSRYQFVPAPIAQGAYDFNSKIGAKWISEHPFIWYPVRQGTPNAAYRLQYQGMNADGSPNAKGYDVRIHGSDGTPRYYEVKEADALKKGQ